MIDGKGGGGAPNLIQYRQVTLVAEVHLTLLKMLKKSPHFRSFCPAGVRFVFALVRMRRGKIMICVR